MSLENWSYEVKCRRCGSTEVFHFSTKEHFTWTDFSFAMSSYIAEPRQFWCKQCNKDTVQDVISYSTPHSNF